MSIPPMRVKPADPLHANEVLTVEQQAAIGCVAVESARLEHLIMVMIWSLLSLEVSMGRLVTDNISTISGKLDLLHGIVNNEFSVLPKKEFNDIFKVIKNIIPRRNTVIHGQWEPMLSVAQFMKVGIKTPTGHARVRSRSRKSKSMKFEDAENIMSIALGVHQCYSALNDFAQRHKLLPPSPDKIW